MKTARKVLRSAAAKRAKSDRLRTEATDATVAAIRTGLAAGLPVTEIADLVGMSRPSLYELMERHGIVRLGRRTRGSR